MNHLKANILGLALLCCLPMGAQLKWNQAYQTYINQYKDLAIEQMLRYRIPASITLAQGLFESAAGRSDLVRQGNNHFGIKCHNWTGPTQYHDDDARGECFRVYQDARDSYEDHSKFLARQPRYARLFELSQHDYKGWARGLKACGYATNPQYASKLIQIIELYKLNQYDKAKRYDRFMATHSGTDQPVNAEGLLHPIHIQQELLSLCPRRRHLQEHRQGGGHQLAQTGSLQRAQQARRAAQGRHHLSEEETLQGT